MKIKKKIPLIDQHDRYGFWGGKFGGSFIPETLKKPIEDLTKEFSKLRNNKNFLLFLNFANSFVKSSTGFFKVSGIKLPPNLLPQKPS